MLHGEHQARGRSINLIFQELNQVFASESFQRNSVVTVGGRQNGKGMKYVPRLDEKLAWHFLLLKRVPSLFCIYIEWRTEGLKGE